MNKRNTFYKNTFRNILLIFIGLVIFPSAHAQSDTAKKLGLVVKVDILDPVRDVFDIIVIPNQLHEIYNISPDPYFKRQIFSVSAEKFIGQNTSAQLTSYFGYESEPGNFSQFHFYHHIVGIMPEAKYYFSKTKQHNGLYTGAYLIYEHDLSVEINPAAFPPIGTINNNYNFYGGGVLGGFQYYLIKKIAIEFQLGVGLADIVRAGGMPNIPVVLDYNTGINLIGSANINLGYKFD